MPVVGAATARGLFDGDDGEHLPAVAAERQQEHVVGLPGVVGGGRGVTVIPPKGVADAGVFTLEPRRGSSIAKPRRCAPLVSVDDRSPTPGFATAEVNIAAAGESPAWQVVVETFRAQGGQPFDLPFDLAVVC